MRLALAALFVLSTPAMAIPPGKGQAPTVSASTVFQVTPVATLSSPWALAFLPNGSMLVTEKPGRLRLVGLDGSVSAPIPGVPAVAAGGQGGLLDVVVSPNFATNRQVYLSFSEPGPNGTSGLAVGRGRYANGQLKAFAVVWRDPVKTTGGHFSARLAFGSDGTLYIASGDRQQATPAQDLNSAQGKVLHVGPGGGALTQNPFFDRTPVRSRLWTTGHRNILGMAFDTQGRLWTHENGPQGGDELNRIEVGSNYGWPVVSNGRNYGAPNDDIPDHDTRPDLNAPEVWWDPSLAPSGLVFYSGALFPQFQGQAFAGALAGQALLRIQPNGDAATEQVRYSMNARIRDVDQGPDGALWVLEDGGSGRLLRLTPR